MNTETTNFIRTLEPSEACELESMYVLADWLSYASENILVSQERYQMLLEYLNTIHSWRVF